MNAYTVFRRNSSAFHPSMLQAPALAVGEVAGVSTFLLFKRMTIKRIQEVVAAFYGIPEYEMTSQRRARQFARPRQIAMFLARELTPQSLPTIGKHFGGRDHTTVIHAINKVQELYETDGDFAVSINVLREKLAA